MVKRLWLLMGFLSAVVLFNSFDVDQLGSEHFLDAYAQSLFPRYLIDCTERMSEAQSSAPEVMQCILFNRFTGQFKVFQVTPEAVTLLSDTQIIDLESLNLIPRFMHLSCFNDPRVSTDSTDIMDEVRCLIIEKEQGLFFVYDIGQEEIKAIGQGSLRQLDVTVNPGKFQLDCAPILTDEVQSLETITLRCLLLDDTDTNAFSWLDIQGLDVIEPAPTPFTLFPFGGLEENLVPSCTANLESLNQSQTATVYCAVIDADSRDLAFLNLLDLGFGAAINNGVSIDNSFIDTSSGNLIFTCVAHHVQVRRDLSIVDERARCLTGNADTGEFSITDIDADEFVEVSRLLQFDVSGIDTQGDPGIEDRDQDGVPDDEDACPDFPGRPAASGC